MRRMQGDDKKRWMGLNKCWESSADMLWKKTMRIPAFGISHLPYAKH
jgi:hypothetical protein